MILDSDSQRWRILYELSRSLMRYDPLDLSKILQKVLEHIGSHTRLRSGCIVTFEENGDVNEAFTLDIDAIGTDLWEHLFNRGLMGFVHHSQRTIVIRDITHDPRWPHPPDTINAPQAGAAVGIPLRLDDEPLGVMMFVHPEVDSIDETGQSLLEEIADLVSHAASRERQRREEQHTVERYQWLFEDAITPVLLTDTSGKIITANRQASQFLGYPMETLLTMSIKDIRQSTAKKPLVGNTTSPRTNMLAALETTVKAANGDELPVRLKMRKRRFKNNPVIEYVMMDIRVEVELSRLRQDMTAMVFHDLRAPLQNVKFSIATIKRLVPSGNPQIDKTFRTAESSISQLSRMIASLLDIQRLEASDTVLNRKITPMRKIIRGAVDQTMGLVEAANQSFNFVGNQSELSSVNVDPDMLQRVLTNLIENATKYAGDKGTITLAVKREVGHVHVFVADDGPGIPKEMRERIFDKFSQVKYSAAPNGVGLGLAFCKLAIEAHGGRIWVESEVSKGAEFHFTLPIGEIPSDTRKSAPTAQGYVSD